MESVPELLGSIITYAGPSNPRRQIHFTLMTGEKYVMYHPTRCCDYAIVDHITGNLSDLEGSVITDARKETSREEPPEPRECHRLSGDNLWTYYYICTDKASVIIRWYSYSNEGFPIDVIIEEVK